MHAAGAKRRRLSASNSEKVASQQLTQLRLACDHPQLTQYWRALSQEMQLDNVRPLKGPAGFRD